MLPRKPHGDAGMALDRLGTAWESFAVLSANDKRQFLRWTKEWYLARRLEAIAVRGGTYGPRPPPQSPLAGLSLGDALDRDDADDLRNIRW
jgi:hypothetical protein